MRLSIIIPFYNEEKTIGKVIEKVSNIKLLDAEKEIIVIDDGSNDDSAKAAKEAIKNSKNTNIQFLHHDSNWGKGRAVRTGILHATGDYILVQDADLEYNPNDIQRLFAPIQAGKTKVVYGTRLSRLPNFTRDERTPLFFLHYLGNRLLSFITTTLYGQWLTDMETGYKLFPKKYAQALNLKSRSFEFEPEITAKLLKRGHKILEVPISTNPRGYKEGKKLRASKDGVLALWTLIKYRFTD